MPKLDASKKQALIPGDPVDEDTKPGCLARHIPILTWLPQYKMSWLQTDISCGITLGLMCLSQTLAQAQIAGVKPVSGTYTAFVPPIVYAMLGTSRHCSVSSGSMGAILIASVLDPSLPIEARTELATLLALISGLFQILMGMCNLAFAVRFLSQATISGFTSGAAILIIASQMKSLLGFTPPPPPPESGAEGKFYEAFANWRRANWVDFALCVIMLIMLDLLKKLKSHAKSKEKAATGSQKTKWNVIQKVAEMKEIIVIIVGIIFAKCTEKQNGDQVITMLPVLRDIPNHLPAFQPPFGEAALALWNGPVAKIQSFVVSGIMIAFTSFLTTYASNKRLAMAFNYELDASQELFALGTACVAGSFFGAFPVCGSLSRSALAGQLGSKTQIASLVVAGIIALSLLFMAPILYYLPMCALAAIVMTSAASLFDFDTPKEIWRSSKETFRGGLHKDFIVWCIGFGCTVQFGALTGIGVAVAVGLAQVVGEATNPRASILGAVGELGGQYRDVEDWPAAQTIPGLLVFEIRGPLCFCSAEGFHEELVSRMSKDVHAVCLCFGSVEYIDYSALSVLKDILQHFKADHVDYIIADAKPNVDAVLKEKLGGGKDPLVDPDLKGVSVAEAVDLLEARLTQHISKRESLERLTTRRLEEAHHFDDVHHTHLSK